MEIFSELITQSDADTTKVLEWISKLANTATGRRLLAAKKEFKVLGNAGLESLHDGVYDGDAGGV